jgi:tetratricopeptide (TPR) repeat protein
MASNAPPSTPVNAALIHREILRLVALVLLAVGAFFVTKTVAGNNRDLSLRNAAEWYSRGERLAANGQLDDAIDAFRRATVRNRTNRTYLFALSRALAGKHDYDSARAILLTIRESAPEDAEINLALARLSVARQDLTEARRFFYNALYAPWPSDQAGKRRAVRIELIRFLLAHQQTGRARSELLAANVDLPDDDVPRQLELATLFSEAGDGRNALTLFERVLRVAPDNTDALAGAGKAAFDLAEYSLARRYLREIPGGNDEVRQMRDVLDLVLSRDPVASRIGARERHRRLDENLSYVEQRLDACMAARATPSTTDRQALHDELQAFIRRFRRSGRIDQDTIESGADLTDRAERALVMWCGPATTVDRALLLIARRHGAGGQ